MANGIRIKQIDSTELNEFVNTKLAGAGNATKVVMEIPATNANTNIALSHNLGISGVTVVGEEKTYTVYPVSVQVFESSTGKQVLCDITSNNANSITLKFNNQVSKGQYYCIIIG